MNLIKSYQIWIVVTLFRLIWHQTKFPFVSNQSERYNSNPSLVRMDKVQIRFLSVLVGSWKSAINKAFSAGKSHSRLFLVTYARFALHAFSNLRTARIIVKLSEANEVSIMISFI